MRIFLAICCLLLASSALAELPSGNQASIQAALSSGRPTLVDFGARSCIPCKKMAPILEQLEKEYKGRANVIFIDVWQDNKIGGNYRVQMIPTQIFFDARGKETGRHIGFMDRQPIIDTLGKLGVK
ncbi:MAG: thioredoxin family protein [Geobacter sp.]|nr:thioredoxin family protein [Geobacter sp.]